MLRLPLFVVLLSKACLNLCITFRQFRVLGRSQTLEDTILFTEKEYGEAVKYGKACSVFCMIKITSDLIKDCTIVYTFPLFYEQCFKGGASANELIFTTYLCANALFSYIFKTYFESAIERRFGLINESTFSVSDFLLTGFFTYGFIYALTSLTFRLMKKWKRFYVYAWVFVSSLILFAFTLLPYFIVLCSKEVSHPPERLLLNKRFQQLVKNVGFNPDRVLIKRASRKTSKVNAYQAGIGAGKMIVIYDTFFTDAWSDDQVIAVFCHELGHWAKNHILIHASIIIVILFIKFHALDNRIKSSQGTPLGLKAIEAALWLSGLSAFTDVITISATRIMEKAADLYAVQKGFGNDLKSALIKFIATNKEPPSVDKLYSILKRTHPSVFERIAYIEKAMSQG